MDPTISFEPLAPMHTSSIYLPQFGNITHFQSLYCKPLQTIHCQDKSYRHHFPL